MVSFPSRALPLEVGGRPLAPLMCEQEIWFQMQPGESWKRARVKTVQSNRSYLIEAPSGRQYVRNRRFLRPFVAGNPVPDPNESEELQPAAPDGGEGVGDLALRRSRRQVGLDPEDDGHRARRSHI